MFRALFLSLFLAASLAAQSGTLQIYADVSATKGGEFLVHGHGLQLGQAPTYLIFGFSTLDVPFGDYYLIPSIDWVDYVLTDGDQGLDFHYNVWPDLLPAGVTVTVQAIQNVSMESPGPGTWALTTAASFKVKP